MNKKNQRISSFSNDLQIACPRHEGFVITHGCFNVDCTQEMLFCSSCLLENLTHITEHQRYISPIPNFINEFYSHLSNLKENLRPLAELNYYSENHLNNWERILKEQKQLFHNEMNELQNRFINMIDQMREDFDNETGKFLKDIEGCYQAIQEINVIDFNYKKSKEDFLKKINKLKVYEINEFFLEMRSSLKSLRAPINSKIIKKYINFSQRLESIMNKTNIFSLSLSENVQCLMGNLFNEISQKTREFLSNFQNNEMKSSSFGKTQIFENAKTPTKILKNQSVVSNNISPLILKNHSDVSNNISPLVNNKSFSTYFPKKLNDSELKTSNLMSSFRNMSKINKFDIFETPSQKNFLIKNDFSYNKENPFNLDVKMEAFFDENSSFSTLCLIDLNENLLVTSGKDAIVRVFEFIQHINHKSNLKLIKTFQNPQDPSPIWSLAKLTAINHQKNDFGVFYFASGSENGLVSVWKFDHKNNKLSEHLNKPLIELVGNPIVEIITAILDLNDGKHLICGDSKGSLMVWDFLYGQLIQNMDVHKEQINSIISYNDGQNLAVGSYDGNLSLWEVSNRNKEKLEVICSKIIKNNFYIYGLTSLYSRNHNIVVVDSQKKVKILDIKTMMYIKESEYLTKSETLMDILCVEYEEKNHCFPIVLCFTKNQMIILNGDTLETIKIIDNNEMENNFIGTTMNSNYKVVFINKKSGNLEKENSIFFGIIDQSQKSRRVLSIFNVCL